MARKRRLSFVCAYCDICILCALSVLVPVLFALLCPRLDIELLKGIGYVDFIPLSTSVAESHGGSDSHHPTTGAKDSSAVALLHQSFNVILVIVTDVG